MKIKLNRIIFILFSPLYYPPVTEFSMISASLSRALSYINRHHKAAEAQGSALSARVLVISVSPDAAWQYIPIMNTIFSAQKSVN